MKKLCLILPIILNSCLVAKKSSELKFEAGEHIYIGQKAYNHICNTQSIPCPSKLKTQNQVINFDYGELVAFSGDFYKDPNTLYLETEAKWGKFYDNDIKTVKNKFAEESDVIRSYLHGHNTQFPDNNFMYLFSIPEYLAIAKDNKNHFGFYNMLDYVKHHGDALILAQKAKILKDKGFNNASEIMLQKAMFYNAFADHFLTDAFAAGHIRAPHKHTLLWGKSKGLSKNTTGILTKIIHDQDGRITKEGDHGLPVTNSLGKKWFTKCDSQLFQMKKLIDESIRTPIGAVMASIQEVLDTYKTGQIPEGVYEAAKHAPFPDNSESDLLTERFPPSLKLSEAKKMLADLAFYMKIEILSGLNEKIIQSYFKDLPQTMNNFRNDVKNIITTSPEQVKHLPEEYLNAYQNIK